VFGATLVVTGSKGAVHGKKKKEIYNRMKKKLAKSNVRACASEKLLINLARKAEVERTLPEDSTRKDFDERQQSNPTCLRNRNLRRRNI